MSCFFPDITCLMVGNKPEIFCCVLKLLYTNLYCNDTEKCLLMFVKIQCNIEISLRLDRFTLEKI